MGVGELNRRPDDPDRPDASDPPDRPAAPDPPETPARPDRGPRPDQTDDARRAEPTARPDSTARSVTPEQRAELDRLTGISPRHDRRSAPETEPVTDQPRPLTDPATAPAEIADLKTRCVTDKATITGQEAPVAPDRSGPNPDLAAAHAKIADLEKQVSTLESDKAEVNSELDAANTKIADQEKRLDEQSTKLDTYGTALGELQESVKRLQDRRPEETGRAGELDRIDERASTPEMRDDRLSKPKRERGELRVSAVETAIAQGGFVGTTLSAVAEMPGYVTSVAAAGAGAAWATTRFVRKWREDRNEDRSGG